MSKNELIKKYDDVLNKPFNEFDEKDWKQCNNPDLILGLYSTKDKGLRILDMMEELADDF